MIVLILFALLLALAWSVLHVRQPVTRRQDVALMVLTLAAFLLGVLLGLLLAAWASR